jgi:hypothetical protein
LALLSGPAAIAFLLPAARRIHPALDVGKFGEVNTILQSCRPRIANHIGDRVFTGRQVALLMQALVERRPRFL